MRAKLRNQPSLSINSLSRLLLCATTVKWEANINVIWFACCRWLRPAPGNGERGRCRRSHHGQLLLRAQRRSPERTVSFFPIAYFLFPNLSAPYHAGRCDTWRFKPENVSMKDKHIWAAKCWQSFRDKKRTVKIHKAVHNSMIYFVYYI
jgi:hypothetical protein